MEWVYRKEWMRAKAAAEGTERARSGRCMLLDDVWAFGAGRRGRLAQCDAKTTPWTGKIATWSE